MELARARESLKIQNKYKIMQAFADLRRKAKMQRQLEREQSGDIPRPFPVGSQAASEDFDAKTANSRTSQVFGFASKPIFNSREHRHGKIRGDYLGSSVTTIER